MHMLQSIFYALSTLVTIYSIVCLIRIVLSWMPDIDYSPVGRFFASLCDPFLSWFQRFSFTRVGMVDFSPILALGVLSVFSMIFSTLGATGKITTGIVIAGLLQVIWSFFSFLFVLFIICLAIRLIYDLVNRYSYSQFWGMLDRFLNPLISRVTGIFTRGRKAMSYRASIILTLAVMLLLWLALAYGVKYLLVLLYAMPF
jgi:YggT family protein